MKQVETEQISLIPEYHPSTTVAFLDPVELVVADGAMEPSGPLLEHIKKFGVLQPVIVQQKVDASGDAIYTVLDGRRRTKASIKAKLELIPVLIVEDGASLSGDVVTLATNKLRGDSTATAAQAVVRLTEAGHPEAEIRKATGLTVADVRRFQRLTGLSPVLRGDWERGAMATSVALAAAKLPQQYQASLEARMVVDGTKLTAAHVAEVKHARREDAPLPGALIDVVDDWKPRAQAALEALLAVVPEGHTARATLDVLAAKLRAT